MRLGALGPAALVRPLRELAEAEQLRRLRTQEAAEMRSVRQGAAKAPIARPVLGAGDFAGAVTSAVATASANAAGHHSSHWPMRATKDPEALKRLLEIRRSIQHQIDGSSGMGTVGPAPEAERKWREGQGVDGGHRIAAVGPEQIGLICALRGAAKQRGLMVMQPLLPGPQLIGIQRQLRWR